MKSKFKILTVLLIIMLSITLLFSAKVFATEAGDVGENTDGDVVATSEENETQGESNDIYEGDLYVLFSEDNNYNSTTYVMDKKVDGNVFIFGENVRITGQINGSLFVFASNVTIDEDAYIGCHIFMFADTITMSGFTYDMYAACNNFEMTKDGVVYRDLKLGADSAVLLGSVGRNIDLSASTIKAYENDEENLYVGGNLNYASGSKIENIDKITVNGEVKYTEEKQETSSKTTVTDYIYKGIENIIFAIVIYAVLIFLAPKFVEKSKEYMSTRALLAGAIGLAFTILVPIVAFILLFTGFGISISFIMFMIYVIVLMINSSVVTIAINEFIANKIEAVNTVWKKILMIIPVSLVIFLLRQIPYLGGILTIIILLVGVGITLLYQFDKRKKVEQE